MENDDWKKRAAERREAEITKGQQIGARAFLEKTFSGKPPPKPTFHRSQAARDYAKHYVIDWKKHNA